MSFEGYTTIKKLQDFPLSQVELVEKDGKKFILKSVPSFFEIQARRQDALAKRCKETRVPKIYWIKKVNERIYFLMEFIESDKQYIPQRAYIQTVQTFHKETVGWKNELFPIYDYNAFLKEFPRIEPLLPRVIVKSLEMKLVEFEAIFHLQNSIVHGDWVRAQLKGRKGAYAILDFEMAFYGPSILDHAHFFLKHKTIRSNVLKELNVERDTFMKARIVETLRKIGWFLWFMDNKFTTYKFESEIKEHVKSLDRFIKHF
jgi:hypothetical protein